MKNCKACTVAKPDCSKPKARMSHLYSEKPNGLICIDFLTSDKVTSGILMFHLNWCALKFSRDIATKDQTVQTIAKVLMDHWFNVYGVPERIHSDQGINFESQLVLQLWVIYGLRNLKHLHIIPM